MASGMPDHVHLLVRLKADLAVAEAVRLVKSNSSGWVNENQKIRGRFEWQTGYFAAPPALPPRACSP